MIQLLPMSDAVYAAFRDHASREYAREKVEAGTWEPDGAQARSEAEFSRLLPQGKDTLDNYLFSVVTEDNTPVGSLWFAVVNQGAGPMAFVYDIEILPEHRRRGYAAQALKALEAKARELRLSAIALHVFGHNKGAQELYAKAGFEVTDISMAKKVV